MRITIALMSIVLLFQVFNSTGYSDDGNFEDILSKAQTLIENKQYTRAEAILRSLAGKLPADQDMQDRFNYDLGRSLIGQKRFSEAVPLLKSYCVKHPSDAVGAYNYGLALLFSDDPKGSEEQFSRAAKLDPKLAPDALYYTGIAYLKTGRHLDAADVFRRVIQEAPYSKMARESRAMLSGMIALARERMQELESRRQASIPSMFKMPTKQKPWTLSFSAGLEYDDNVALIPDSTQILPEEISHRGAWRFVYSLGGMYEFYNNNGHNIGINANYAGTKNFDLPDYNVDTIFGGLYWKYTKAPFQLRFTPFAANTWVGGSPDSYNWGFSPGISYRQALWTWTDLDYNYSKNTYRRTPPTPAEDRDSDTQWFSLRQNISFQSLLIDKQMTSFSVGILRTFENASGLSYDNESLGGTFTLQQGLPYGFLLRGSYTYRKIDYDNPNDRSAEGDKRSDREHLAGVTLYKRINDYLTAYLGYRYYENNSNIRQSYWYRSNVTLFGLRVDM